MLISPKNEVLLVQRVNNASTFPSAHVFPGGKHDDDQDGRLQKGNSDRQSDGKEFRRCAIRELFEESGILLARNEDSNRFVELDNTTREEGRNWVRKGSLKFQPWLKTLSRNARPDISKLPRSFSRPGGL